MGQPVQNLDSPEQEGPVMETYSETETLQVPWSVIVAVPHSKAEETGV